jgi:hypothetical protein
VSIEDEDAAESIRLLAIGLGCIGQGLAVLGLAHAGRHDEASALAADVKLKTSNISYAQYLATKAKGVTR